MLYVLLDLYCLSTLVFGSSILVEILVFGSKFWFLNLGVWVWKTPKNNRFLWKTHRGSVGSYIRHASGSAPNRKLYVFVTRCGRGGESRYSTRLRGAGEIHGSEGETINTPVAVVYCSPGQAVLIFFNSRRQSVRKLSTVRGSFALGESAPNCR